VSETDQTSNVNRKKQKRHVKAWSLLYTCSQGSWSGLRYSVG